MRATEGEPLAAQHRPGPELERRLKTLHDWLVNEAYPRWARHGYDRDNGGFEELLEPSGPVLGAARRARVQARQLYAFARATDLGWPGDATELIAGSWEYFSRNYRRPDGLYRTLIAPDGTVLDDRALLYDQAFVLLALAEWHRHSRYTTVPLAAARELRGRLFDLLRGPGPGFRSGRLDGLPLLSNPHMHLLEAVQNWALIDADPAWQSMAEEIVALALSRMIDPTLGVLFERFDERWRALSGEADRLIEPGHQFEWAWLLLRTRATSPSTHRTEAARRLVEIGETYGVHGGVVVLSLHADFSVNDGQGRLWAQTERLKAALALGRLTHDSRYWHIATLAADSVWRYIDADAPGLWRDRLRSNGEFLAEPTPASTFYHLVVAIAEGRLEMQAA